MKYDLIFDLDDTLIQTQAAFRQNIDLCADLVYEVLGGKVIINDIKEVFNKIDLELIKELGFSKKRYPFAWGSTLEFFIKKYNIEISSTAIEQLQSLAKMIFQENVPLQSDTFIIEELAIHKDVASMTILTLGEKDVQTKRVMDTGLVQYFDEVIITQKKDINIYFELNKKLSNPVMIGNSLRSDIVPAIDAGMKAIHIIRDSWSYDEIEHNHRIDSIQSLDELKLLLFGNLVNQ
ncbi:HAD family hydrolase [Gottfriedia sp. NPDC056225]|uniref:HAD family hydrolase n=1 Tax=Gottfriedia sp. NPDC056225 TaxID=3345751 RepID=UPI0035DE126C